MNIFLGVSASTGIGIGKAFVIPEAEKRQIPAKRISLEEKASELAKFDKSLANVIAQISAQMEAAKGNKVQSEIFETYYLMLNDPEFLKGVRQNFDKSDYTIAYILDQETEKYAERLESSGNEYLAERAQDIRDIFGRVLDDLLDFHPFNIEDVPDGAVIVARAINPSDTIVLSKRKLAGIALIEGGISSHVAILARNFGIPAVFALDKITSSIKHGDTVIVDGNVGEVIDEPDNDCIENYRQKIMQEEEARKRLAIFRDKKAVTKDGVPFTIMANVGSVEEARIALQEGADGIGLFRSEFLFMDASNSSVSKAHARVSAFSEESQFKVYKEVLEIMKGKPVTIRTLDAGGDKIINSQELKIEAEKNPLMGLRAIRLSLVNPSQLKTQFKALFRAAVYGNLKIMLPLITSVEQVREAKIIANKAKEELSAENKVYKDNVPIGIMVETAAAAIIADCLAKESDFFSIGTNDLIQYTIGVDRENTSVLALYDEFHLAVKRLIKRTIEEADKAGIPISVCGEMASRKDSMLLLGGMGIRCLSMSPKEISKTKEQLSKVTVDELKEISTKSLNSL